MEGFNYEVNSIYNNYNRRFLDVDIATRDPSNKHNMYRFIKFKTGQEIPLYLASFTREYTYNTAEADGLRNPIYQYIPTHTNYKSLGAPFIKAFNNMMISPVKIQINTGQIYYVAKGTIMLEDTTPIIQMSYKITGPDITHLTGSNARDFGTSGYSNFSIDANHIKIYINRKLFSEEFKEEHPRMYNIIMSKIMPIVLSIPAPMIIKKEIDLWHHAKPYSGTVSEKIALNNFIDRYGDNIVTKLSSRIQLNTFGEDAEALDAVLTALR